MQWGPATVTFGVLVLLYVVLLRATEGSKYRRIVVPVVMVPLVLLALWSLRWMFWS